MFRCDRLGLSLCAAALVLVVPGLGSQLAHYQGSRVSMACTYAIDAYGPDADALPRIVNDAFDEVDRIDRLMSNYKADSPLSAINRDAATHPVAVDAELFDFLATSLRYTRESDGAFDITVGPLMKAWGFFQGDGHVPADADLSAARHLVGASHVILDAGEKTVRFDRPGVELDLGGIAKGYAVDRVVTRLRDRGVTAALVSAGGSTIYGLGAPADHAAWNVQIQDPVDPQRSALTVQLKDRALSIAGTSEKFFEAGGVRYSHIMDPRTGRPVQGILSVAVLAPTGTAGDALDDAFFVMGVDRARMYVQARHGVEGIFFLPDPATGWKMVRESR
jgi:thiamine biosynthesis lipoprotein